MPATQLATKATETRPPAAEAEQKTARAAVERLTKAISELRREGPGGAADEYIHLEAERDAALKRLRHADLAVEELAKAEAAPLSTKLIEKIRRQRRKAHDLHPALMARASEHRRLRELRYSLENSIAAATSAGPFKRAQQELKSRFVYGHGDPERPEPPETQPMPPSINEVAKLERALTTTITELEIAAAVSAEAQARWQSERLTLESWESAVHALGPAARLMLAGIAQPSDADSKNNSGRADVSVGPNAVPRSAGERR